MHKVARRCITCCHCSRRPRSLSNQTECSICYRLIRERLLSAPDMPQFSNESSERGTPFHPIKLQEGCTDWTRPLQFRSPRTESYISQFFFAKRLIILTFFSPPRSKNSNLLRLHLDWERELLLGNPKTGLPFSASAIYSNDLACRSTVPLMLISQGRHPTYPA